MLGFRRIGDVVAGVLDELAISTGLRAAFAESPEGRSAASLSACRSIRRVGNGQPTSRARVRTSMVARPAARMTDVLAQRTLLAVEGLNRQPGDGLIKRPAGYVGGLLFVRCINVFRLINGLFGTKPML